MLFVWWRLQRAQQKGLKKKKEGYWPDIKHEARVHERRDNREVNTSPGGQRLQEMWDMLGQVSSKFSKVRRHYILWWPVEGGKGCYGIRNTTYFYVPSTT